MGYVFDGDIVIFLLNVRSALICAAAARPPRVKTRQITHHGRCAYTLGTDAKVSITSSYTLARLHAMRTRLASGGYTRDK